MPIDPHQQGSFQLSLLGNVTYDSMPMLSKHLAATYLSTFAMCGPYCDLDTTLRRMHCMPPMLMSLLFLNLT
jgi:hypothetical protein